MPIRCVRRRCDQPGTTAAYGKRRWWWFGRRPVVHYCAGHAFGLSTTLGRHRWAPAHEGKG